MVQPAGKRRFKIQFQQPTVSRASVGTKKTASWSSLGYAMARVFYGTGAERREAGVEQASQSATFNVLSDSVTRAATAEGRIVFGGLNWDITGIAPLLTAPAEIEFTAVASRG